MHISPVTIDTTPAPQRGWTPALKARFLDRLAAHGNARAASRAAGLSHEAAYRLRRRDEEFARGWAAALVLARENGAHALGERAIEGIEEPVWYRGKQVGTRRRFDTRLLLAHLARLDRLADEESAGLDAARFDELLARIAGEAAPGMDDSDDDLLPLCREAFVDFAAEAAEDALVPPTAETAGGRARALNRAERAEFHATCEAAAARARAEAEGAWDAWFCRACAVVDAHAGWPGARPLPGLPGHPLPSWAAGPSGSGRADVEAGSTPFTPGLSKGHPELVEGSPGAAPGCDPGMAFSFPRTMSTASTSALARALAGPARNWPGVDRPLHGRRSLRRSAIDLKRGAA